MTRIAVALLAVSVLATSCGGRSATTAAEVVPRSATALLSLPGAAEPAETRRSLALLPGGARVQQLIDRTTWSRAAGGRVQVAALPEGNVAFALPADRKKLDAALDAAGLAHVRARGWTAFAPRAAALEQVKHARVRLDGAAWFRAASRAAGSHGLTVVARDGARWAAFRAEHGEVSRTTPGGGSDAPHPLAARIPADAVAAAADHRAGELLRTLPFAAALERGFGLRAAELARLAPRSAVLYLRAGVPFPSVTLLAAGARLAEARAVARSLDPVAPPPVPATLDGIPVSHLALGAVDLYYGAAHGATVLTDDALLEAKPPERLDPDGLPERTAGWLYLDVRRGVPALEALAQLGETPLSPAFLLRLAGLEQVLAYTTHTERTTTLTVDSR